MPDLRNWLARSTLRHAGQNGGQRVVAAFDNQPQALVASRECAPAGMLQARFQALLAG